MGRFDPSWTDEQNTEAVRLVLEQGMSQRQAAEQMGMSDSHIGRLINSAEPPQLDDQNPVGDMANRAIVLANRELASLERTHSKHTSGKPVDMDRLAKITKNLIDLDKLLKANRTSTTPPAEDHPLAGLAKAMNGSTNLP